MIYTNRVEENEGVKCITEGHIYRILKYFQYSQMKSSTSITLGDKII